ncbi:hypothetical protein J6590_016654 [Homalodisca vitripennis]|nr:hypothetical protein J6590_016654 [Homalodisca vitripennis]
MKLHNLPPEKLRCLTKRRPKTTLMAWLLNTFFETSEGSISKTSTIRTVAVQVMLTLSNLKSSLAHTQS